jgi:hypothetical protein
MSMRKNIFTMCVLAAVVLFVQHKVICQTEKLGIVRYTPPPGWKKTPGENIVTYSELNETTGRFCTITLYGATPGTGKPQSDFTREWNNLVVKPFKGDPNPKTETEAAGGWTAIAGGSAVDFQGSKALALLTVYSGFGKTVSVLGIFNDEAYSNQLTAFVTGMDMDKTVADNRPSQLEESLPPVPVASTAVMNVNALAKEFQDNEVRANQQWIGKRVRVSGIVNTIVIARDGSIELTFKTSITNYNMARCHFNKSQSAGVATLTAHQEGTVEGTVRGLGGGFDNSKTFFLLEDCVVP